VGSSIFTTTAAIGGYYKMGAFATNDYFGLGYFNVESSNDWYPTAGVPALTIKYDGNVGIGTTSPASKLELRNSVASIQELLRLNNPDGSGAGTRIGFTQGGTQYGKIDVIYSSGWQMRIGAGDTVTDDITIKSGYVSIGTLAGIGNRAVYSDSSGVLTNASSDIRLKKNVEPIQYGLDSIMRLNPISYNWIPENLGNQKELGFIAQEVGTIIPELIGVNNNGMQSLDYAKMTAILVKAVQELSTELLSLKQTLNIN
jgi:hypothetical protein